MINTKTIGTILVSVILGAVTFFIATPKKVVKKKERSIAATAEDNSSNLFI